MSDDRFNSLKNQRAVKNKRGQPWVDLPKNIPDCSDVSDIESEECIGSIEDNDSDVSSLDSFNDDSNDRDFNNLTENAKTTDISTKRLAVVHFDFEHYTLEYLALAFKSELKTTGGKIKSITKYPTEEYMQRIEDDLKFGPKEYRIQEYNGKDFDSDDSCDSTELYKANKDYAISRLKFFIAIFEFDSVVTSDFVYNALDDTNLDDSGLKFDLRFVPDDKTFEIPDAYMHLVQTLRPNSVKFKNVGFKPSCFAQSRYTQMWDETPLERQTFYEKAMDQSDCDLSDVENNLGGATDSEFSDAESETEFYTTVDGPVIPKLKRKRIPMGDMRKMLGLNDAEEDSSNEEYEEEDEEEDVDDEEIVDDIEDEENDINEYVVDENADMDDEDSDSSDEGKLGKNEKKTATERSEKKIKSRKKAKLMIKENALKRDQKNNDVRSYLKECAATDDRFDEFLTESKHFRISQTDAKYENTKLFMEMMLHRAAVVNVKPSFTVVNNDESGPAKKKRKVRI